MKRAVLFGMVGLWALGWAYTATHLMEKPNAYQGFIREAEQYEEKGIYIRAIQSYQAALEYQPDSMELKLRIADDYLALGNESSYISQCQSVLEEYGYPLEVAGTVADYYLEKGRTESAISLITETLKVHPDSQEMQERFEKVRYTFRTKYLSYEEIFSVYNGCAVFLQDGKYGLLSVDGSTVLRNSWDEASVWSSDRELIPVMGDGEACYVNRNGYRYEVPGENQKVDWLGPLSGNVAAAKINGKYGYIDSQFHELCEFQWDGATGIAGDLGAVMRDGKWTLINGNREPITDYVYDDVMVNEYGFGSTAGRMFVRTGESWQMVNQKGETVGSESFEDARPFASSQPTAAKKNGKWGFVNADGVWVIEPQYDEADAFSDGLAPVRTGEAWGFINSENKMVIGADFTGAHSFYGGIAPVKTGNTWTLIQLNVR